MVLTAVLDPPVVYSSYAPMNIHFSVRNPSRKHLSGITVSILTHVTRNKLHFDKSKQLYPGTYQTGTVHVPLRTSDAFIQQTIPYRSKQAFPKSRHDHFEPLFIASFVRVEVGVTFGSNIVVLLPVEHAYHPDLHKVPRTRLHQSPCLWV